MSAFSFPPSGDPEQDAAQEAALRRREARIAEGLCPNACGPITYTSSYQAECVRCRWKSDAGAAFIGAIMAQYGADYLDLKKV